MPRKPPIAAPGPPLMLLPASALAVSANPKPRGLYAALPGTGPASETCGTCKHAYFRQMASTYYKCELVRQHWTGGAGTDIKLRSPACSKFEKGERQ